MLELFEFMSNHVKRALTSKKYTQTIFYQYFFQTNTVPKFLKFTEDILKLYFSIDFGR